MLSIILLQDETVAKLVVKQSRLRVVDLGSNRLRTFPRALVKNSLHLNTLRVDDNRLTNCSQMRGVLRRAADLELLDIAENRLVVLEIRCFDELAPGAALRLAGNPLQCSCETAATARWLRADPAAPEVADLDSVFCTGPPEFSGTPIFASSVDLPGSWECRWRADCVVVIPVLVVAVALLVTVFVLARRRFLLTRTCRKSTSVSAQNGSISTVTISNSCYGNGPGGSGGGGGTAPGGGESHAHYSPLIEDDGPSLVPSLSRENQQVPVVQSEFTRGRESAVCNGGVVVAGNEATPCGEIDNEALLFAGHVTEIEESV